MLLREVSDVTFGLTFLNRFDIEDEDAGLTEPSGLRTAAFDWRLTVPYWVSSKPTADKRVGEA